MADKKSMIETDNQFKLIHQVFCEHEEHNCNCVKITPDGQRTVSMVMYDDKDIVAIYDNKNGGSKMAEYKIDRERLKYPGHEFLFSQDATKIVYRTEHNIFIVLDLETGQVMHRETFRGLGPIQYHGNTMLTLDSDRKVIRRADLSLLDKDNKGAFHQDMARFELTGEDPEDSNLEMAVNPSDYSTVVVVDCPDKCIGLYDARKLSPVGSTLGTLRDEDRIASVHVKDSTEIYLKFSPDGRKLAALVCDMVDGEHVESWPEKIMDLSIYDACDNLRLLNTRRLDREEYSWYNDENICFITHDGEVVTWNVDNGNTTVLCSVKPDNYRFVAYVHPSLPLMVTHPERTLPSPCLLYSLWGPQPEAELGEVNPEKKT